LVVLLVLIDILTVGYPWTATVYCRKEERKTRKKKGGGRKEGRNNSKGIREGGKKR
jgi:hypothetical protein